MRKEEKRIKTLSLTQLYEELGHLEEDLKMAKHNRHEKAIEQLVEYGVSDKRIIKDILWITGGFVTFNMMYLFLARPIQDPVWLNYVCSGFCAIATAMSIAATRIGWNKTNEKYGDQIRRHYNFNYAEVEEKRKGLSTTYEDIVVKDLEKKRQLYLKYIDFKSQGDLSPAEIEAKNEYYGRY